MNRTRLPPGGSCEIPGAVESSVKQPLSKAMSVAATAAADTIREKRFMRKWSLAHLRSAKYPGRLVRKQ
jgi:hypothetical protein